MIVEKIHQLMFYVLMPLNHMKHPSLGHFIGFYQSEALENISLIARIVLDQRG